MARHADLCNLQGDHDTLRRKLAVLDEHLDGEGRDRTAVHRTALRTVVIAATAEEVVRKGAALRQAWGLNDAAYASMVIEGTRDEIAADHRPKVLAKLYVPK